MVEANPSVTFNREGSLKPSFSMWKDFFCSFFQNLLREFFHPAWISLAQDSWIFGVIWQTHWFSIDFLWYNHNQGHVIGRERCTMKNNPWTLTHTLVSLSKPTNNFSSTCGPTIQVPNQFILSSNKVEQNQLHFKWNFMQHFNWCKWNLSWNQKAGLLQKYNYCHKIQKTNHMSLYEC